QYSAKEKTYNYHFYVSRQKHPLKDRFSVNIPYDIDQFNYQLAKDSLSVLLGTHDLKPLSSTGSKINNTVRTIYNIDLIKENDCDFTLIITGNGFLYNTVRIIVGTLAKIGLGQLPSDTFSQMLNSGKRNLGGMTYPPRGLFLMNVKYDNI
nr:tRNA pseudouridine(38-40) synthase TruA [Clostridia bacterium]